MSGVLLPERHSLRQEGAEIHELFWPAATKQPHFAVYRNRRGQYYTGVMEILTKPHGLKKIMDQVLRLVAVQELQRWDAIFRRLLKVGSQYQVQDAIDLLVSASILSIRERNKRPNKGEYWSPLTITIDERAIADVVQLFPKPKPLFEQTASLIREVNEVRVTWKICGSPTATKLEELVNAGIERLIEPEKENKFSIHPKAIVKYRSILLTLAYGRALLGQEDYIPLRTLSSLIWENTKILDRYRSSITQIINQPLSAIGITVHPETLWVYGDVTYIMGKNESISLLAGRPSVLAEETIQQACFNPGPNLRAILIVENLTVFLNILRRTYYGRKDVLVLWSDGYWNDTHRRLLRQVLGKRLVPVYVWSDIDGDGLAITQQICKWAIRRGAISQPILMGTEECDLVKSERVASDRDITLASKRVLFSMFPEISVFIKRYKRIVEQERLLAYYHHVEKRLP